MERTDFLNDPFLSGCLQVACGAPCVSTFTFWRAHSYKVQIPEHYEVCETVLNANCVEPTFTKPIPKIKKTLIKKYARYFLPLHKLIQKLKSDSQIYQKRLPAKNKLQFFFTRKQFPRLLRSIEEFHHTIKIVSSTHD
jgi:hypothetical protein